MNRSLVNTPNENVHSNAFYSSIQAINLQNKEMFSLILLAIKNKIINFAQNQYLMIMCNSSEYIKKITDFIYSVLNEQVCLAPINKNISDIIPMSIANRFQIHMGKLFGSDIIFAITEDGNIIPPAQMRNNLDYIATQSGCPTILVAFDIASYNVKRLIAQKVNFIIPQKQIFLPSLLIFLRKRKEIAKDIKETIPAIAQCMLLYHIEICSIDMKTSTELKDIFHVSYSTINRSLRWLIQKKLIALDGVKIKKIRIKQSNKELWDTALPYLVSPIDKVAYTDETQINGLECGINALSKYTMINRDDYDCLAIAKSDYVKSGIISDKAYGTNRIEIWKYNPRLLSHSNTVDKMSLYLSLKNDGDERIQIELEHLINEIIW